MFEGGSKVPSFIYSKSHIPKELWGTTYDNLMHVTDWLPTLTSAAGGEITGSAGALDGIDHWDSLTSVEGVVDPPRAEMLYNWDSYILDSTKYDVIRNDELAQGAFRQGKWKILKNAWCSGYVVYEYLEDPLLTAETVCPAGEMCIACHQNCKMDPDYRFSNWLFNLEDDPHETTNLIDTHPHVYKKLLARAEEVVFSGFSETAYEPFNTVVYDIWPEKSWWITPWWENLEPW